MIVFAIALGLIAMYFEDGREAKGYTLKTWMSMWRELKPKQEKKKLIQ